MDVYTEAELRESFADFKDYALKIEKRNKRLGLKSRLPNMPEEVSENIAKFIVQNHMNDQTALWPKGTKGKVKLPGDLRSDSFGRLEVKCFTSTGPISFGPTEAWDTLLFLDATDWRNDRFVMYGVSLANNDPLWEAVQISKKQTYGDQCKAQRRPRIGWGALSPQITSNCTKVFDGTFDEVFVNIQQTQQGHSSVG
jgi:hypothetical protein